MQPKMQPAGGPSGGFIYDPFHKLLSLQSGKKATQYGDGSIPARNFTSGARSMESSSMSR